MWYALIDIVKSFIYYFAKIFFNIDTDVTINNLKGVALPKLVIIPENTELFIVKLKIYGKMIITGDSLSIYGGYLSSILLYLCYFLLGALPLLFAVIALGFEYEKKVNNDYAKDTKPVKIMRWIYRKLYRPIKLWITKFVKFVTNEDNKAYWLIFAVVWVFNLNGATILAEVFAFYFYFAASLNFSKLYIQAYKLLLDISIPLTILPSWVLVIACFVIFDV